MDFVGGKAEPVAEARAEGVVSYFKGDPEEWQTSIPTHSRIVYRDLWEGIDLVYRSDGPKLKYEFIVHPGADPADIRLRWRGASELSLAPDGSLRILTPAGSLKDDPPVSFQGQKTVETSYLTDGSTVGFRLGAFDPSRTLVIDPVLTLYAGYIGGSGSDFGDDVAVDASGAAYITGNTNSSPASFPETVGPFLTHGGDDDAFVAKVNPQGTALVYAGYIGGSGFDVGAGIALDASGAAYITGYTSSGPASFPDTVGPSLVHSGGLDAFVAKVNPQGTALAYAGYIGGSGGDGGTDIDVAASGAAYITGFTNSGPASFPETVGPFLTPGGLDDAFVAKVNPQGTMLAYAGYIGGSGTESSTGIAVDISGSAHITGYTDSDPTSFPETIGPFLTYAGGSADAFVAKVNPQGTALAYAGYIGGSGDEAGNGIALDASGAAYITGGTNSDPASFPETAGPFLTYGGGLSDAFVAKVNPQGAALAYAGYIGGSGIDGGSGIAVDASGAAYLTGRTSSDPGSFPETVGPSLVYSGGSDAFVAKITDNLCQGAGVTTQGTQGNDTIIGTAGADVIQALGGNDRIDGAGGNDVVCAGDGNDTLIGGAGDDRLDGEAGIDTASFAGTVGVIVDLILGTGTGLGTDTLANIENLSGSSKKDTLRGSSVANVIRGLGGKDRLAGRGAKDRLVGGAANDRLAGGGGNDRLAGGKGDDRMNGGKGRNDRCNGGAGDGHRDRRL